MASPLLLSKSIQGGFMKQTTTLQKNAKVLLMASMTLLMTACANQNSTEDLSSREPVTEVVDSTNTTSAKAYCNQGSGSTFTAQVKAWIEGSKVTRYDFFKAKLTLAESFKTNGNYVQMFRWKANSAGQTYLDSTPLQFRLITNAGVSASDYMSAMSWQNVTQLASALKATTVAGLFQQVQLIVDARDPYAEFDVIKIVVYNSSNQPVDQKDILLPVFSADPVGYAKEADGSARANILRNLHPLKSMQGQSWTPAHYQTIVNGYCF